MLYDQNDSLIGYREMKVGKSRLSQNPLIAHFGLPCGPPFRVMVTFPSGIVVDSSNIAAAQTITIYEPTVNIEEPVNTVSTKARLYCAGSNLALPYSFKVELPECCTAKNATIFDSQGRKVKSINIKHAAEKEMMLVWDGKQDNDHYAPFGIYFLKVNYVNSMGIMRTLSCKIIQLQ